MTDKVPADERITAEVSTLYEEYPYPGHGIVSAVVASMLEEPLRRRQRELGRKSLRLLDAGCGTGEQTIGVQRAFPELEVIGIDLNRASLDMATELARQSGVPARFVRKNLMTPLEDLGMFDVIVSVGVLHSLADPGTGLGHLRKLASPGALLVGMVYGAYGKWDSVVIRDMLRDLCGDASRREQLEVLASSRLASNTNPLHYFDTLVRRLRFGPRIPALEGIRRVLSGRSPAYQADTYTHVQEVLYTYAELAKLLEGTGWSFEGWPRKSGMPDAPEQVLRGKGLELVRRKPLLEQAAIYEKIVRPMNLYFLAAARPVN